ncbi:MAG: VOC family protein [Planctomycetota bacterium]|nr:VOC family protein [Planctomycetota bacterium]
MRVGHVELFVRDVARAREFYIQVLGADLVQEGGGVCWVEFEGTEILLRPGTPPAATTPYSAGGRGLVFYTDDLERTRRRLQARGLEFAGTDGSPACLTFHDPDGHWYQLVDPTDA